MNAREICRHGNNWRECSNCQKERFEYGFAAGHRLQGRRQTVQEFEDREEEDDLLPIHPRFTVEDQIFLSRRCAIKV